MSGHLISQGNYNKCYKANSEKNTYIAILKNPDAIPYFLKLTPQKNLKIFIRSLGIRNMLVNTFEHPIGPPKIQQGQKKTLSLTFLKFHEKFGNAPVAQQPKIPIFWLWSKMKEHDLMIILVGHLTSQDHSNKSYEGISEEPRNLKIHNKNFELRI